MTQHIDFDFSAANQENTDFYFPLSLRIDADEKRNFVEQALNKLRVPIEESDQGLSNVCNADQYFPKTIEQTNQFLEPLGIKSRAMTLFLSSPNKTSWAVHRDGTRFQGQACVLEARLSYFEIAEAPGAIRWWGDEVQTVMREFAAMETNQYRVTAMTDWSADIRDDQLTWDDVPATVFSVSTTAPSALVRTNRPHHVIQGPGLRVTISSQLVFLDGNPAGVWAHIQKNKHLIGV